MPEADDLNRPCHWRLKTGGEPCAAFGRLSGRIRVVPHRFPAMRDSDRGVTLLGRILTRGHPAKATRS
jgi:hypothetical protein